jgi:hypothetical protein
LDIKYKYLASLLGVDNQERHFGLSRTSVLISTGYSSPNEKLINH